MKSAIRSRNSIISEFRRARVFLGIYLFLFITIKGLGQGSGCVNGPTINLSSTSGSVCGLTPVTISNNTFGGSATRVTITEDGHGSVSPTFIFSTPFTFYYTPRHKDEGQNVKITITTNNPSGPCTEAKATYTLTVTSNLSTPVVGTITNPTCSTSTGSVELSNLPSNGTWTLIRSPGGATTTGTGTSTTISGLATGSYTFTVTNTAGCTSASSGNVVINGQFTAPASPTVGTITPPTCQLSTGSVVLYGLPAAGTWMLTRYPGTVTSTGTGSSTTISGLSTGTYNYTITNPDGCLSNPSANVIIPPQTASITMIITNPAAVCSPLNVDLTASVVTAGSTPGLTFTYWRNADATITLATPSTAGEGTYYIKGTLGSGCFDIQPITVTVNPLFTANAGTGGHICSKEFTLNAILTSGTGIWTKINGPGNAVFTPDNHQPNAKVDVDQAGTYNFVWTVGNNICTTSDIVGVIFHDLPSLKASKDIDSDSAICAGTNIQLHAQGIGFFSWAPSALCSNPNISDPIATPVTTTTFTVTLTDQFGCENSDDVKVNVIDKPLANAGPDQLLVSQLGTVMDAVLYNDYETGVWSLISGNGEFFDSTYSKTSIGGLSVDMNTFLWTVSNGICPASSDTVIIMVRDLVIPTLITPNMDGKNDYFIIGGTSVQGKMELVIFDRRGTQVYKNGIYDNLWNGVDYNENPLPEDTYFYVLKTKNDQSSSGYIVIRR